MASATINGHTYNEDPYDPITNPGGFPNGGHAANFVQALGDVVVVAGQVQSSANAAAAAAASSLTYAPTSSATPLTIGSGSKTLTMAAALPVLAGQWLLLSDQAAPTTNYMIGQVQTTPSGTSVTIVVPTTASAVGGSGSKSAWTVQISSPPGVTGATGATGGVTSVAGRTGAVTLAVGDVSGAAPLASPALTGTPTAPTANAGTNTTQLATTQFVQAAISGALTGRNRLANGDFRVMQISGSTTVNSATRVYPIDRWQAFGVGSAGTYTLSRGAGGSGYSYFFTATVGTAAASPGASDSYAILQRIEGPNVADLGFGAATPQSVTLSFIARSSVTGTFSGCLRNGAANRSYPFTYSIPAANTNTTISVTIPGDASGSWPITPGAVGMDLIFCLGSGSNGLGAAGTWAAANYFGATGSVNLMATAGATWSISNVQIERGTSATVFEARPYAAELALCQRHLQVYGEGQSSTIYLFGMCESATTAVYGLPLRVPMMAGPTATFSPTVGDFSTFTAGIGLGTCTGITTTYADGAAVDVTATNASGGMTPGYASRLVSSSSSSRIILRAEL